MKLADLRKEKGLTQRELAQIFHISSGNICDYEKGRVEPSIERIIAFADYFGCTTDELLGRENYGTGIVEVQGEQLTFDEAELLQLYRKMTVQNKGQLVGFAKGLLDR
ncbi:MAG: helix-turn-helix domain-containing protein [Corallococcus sp.]|nr:helix-turn-helix domain-containing protein [Corallococcus sp.]MCM1360027.1 helix-turn-helix domain-containing protein [Corallococcus sp.]MCM1395584.1 helix-turn-helix domain-containing protein [Corallococcus sp.]